MFRISMACGYCSHPSVPDHGQPDRRALLVFVDIDPQEKARRDYGRSVTSSRRSGYGTRPGHACGSGGRIVAFNRASQEVTGYSLEEVRGRRPWEFLVVAGRGGAGQGGLFGGFSTAVLLSAWTSTIGPSSPGGRRLIGGPAPSFATGWGGQVRDPFRDGCHGPPRGKDAALQSQRGGSAAERGPASGPGGGAVEGLQEAERRRLARDLHDDLSQRAVAWAWEASAMAKAGPLAAEDFRVKMNSLVERATQMCSDLEGIARELHPATIEKLGLVPALESLVSEVSGRNRIKIRFTHEELPAAISHETSLALYRVAQEALRNVIRHSGASRAHLNLAAVDGGISLSISDSGRGFHAEQVQRGRGLGLISMEERVRILGGAFSLAAKPGHGVKIQARIPLMPPDGGEL